MKKHIIIDQCKVLALLLALPVGLLYGCKKDAAETIPAVIVTTVPGKNIYADQIRLKTNLVKQIQSDTTYKIAEGVEETHVKYINSDNLPMAVFFLTVNLSVPNISLEAATPNDKPAFTTQTVRSQIIHKNTASSQKQVIAALNGDYWDTNTTGVPLGVVIRNSNVIRPLPADYYFLSVLKDKTCLIGDNARYNLVFSDMNDALGGRYLLVQDKADKSASLNTNVEPRTAVGTLSPKKLVFIFVDGRRAGYSTGITMAGLSKMFRAIGATDAINLDGGGSTTFIIKDKDGQYITRNKPSDNSERAVANAWMIMQDK